MHKPDFHKTPPFEDVNQFKERIANRYDNEHFSLHYLIQNNQQYKYNCLEALGVAAKVAVLDADHSLDSIAQDIQKTIEILFLATSEDEKMPVRFEDCILCQVNLLRFFDWLRHFGPAAEPIK